MGAVALMLCLSPVSPGAAHAQASLITARSGTVDTVVRAGGVRQYIHCEGTPRGATVVLISGWNSFSHRAVRSDGSGGGGWFDPANQTDPAVAPAVAQLTRTCWYDRPGLGKSPARAKSVYVTPLSHAIELLAALSAIGERGPFVVVGHSYGGLIARAFALSYPAKTAGMVLLESAWAGQGADQPDDWYWPEPDSGSHRGVINMHWSADHLGGLPHFGSKPLVVMTMKTTNSAGDQQWMSHQRSMSRLSTNSQHVVAPTSQHVLMHYVPRAVIRSIAIVMTVVRKSGRMLGSCSSQAAAWSAVAVKCVS